jgi:hypothetical protein
MSALKKVRTKDNLPCISLWFSSFSPSPVWQKCRRGFPGMKCMCPPTPSPPHPPRHTSHHLGHIYFPCSFAPLPPRLREWAYTESCQRIENRPCSAHLSWRRKGGECDLYCDGSCNCQAVPPDSFGRVCSTAWYAVNSTCGDVVFVISHTSSQKSYIASQAAALDNPCRPSGCVLYNIHIQYVGRGGGGGGKTSR